MPSATILFWRFAFAAVVLWCAVRITKRDVVPANRLLGLIALGLAYSLMSIAYLSAIKRVGASYGVLLLYAYPAIVALGEHVLGNRITFSRIITITLAVLGIILLVHPGHAGPDALSICIGLGSAVAYALYLIGASRLMHGLSSLTGTAVILASTSGVFLMLAIATNSRLAIASTFAFAVLTLTAMIATAAPILALSFGIRRIGASRAAILGTLEPLTGVILVVLLGGEHLTLMQWFGGLLLIGSSAIPDTPQKLSQMQPAISGAVET